MAWNPEQYLQFQKERYAPFEDLVKLIRVRPNLKIVDLGCGTGDLTRRLSEMLPGSDVTGMDSSPEMLAKAAAHARPGLSFEHRAIEEAVGDWDLVFSHAAIQWVDDHPALIRRLMGLLRPGGQIAVQLPSNQRHPTHTLILETAAEPPFEDALKGWRRDFPVLSVAEYAELLFACGGTEITIFEKVYPHILPDADALVEWMSGTALVPYFERLSPEMRERFIETYRRKLRRYRPERPVFFGFNRTLFAASKPL